MFDHDQIFVPRYPVPRTFGAVVSVLVHLAAFILIALLYRTQGAVIVQQKASRAAQLAASRNPLSYRPVQPAPYRPSILPPVARRAKPQGHKAEVAADSNGDSVEVIRAKAKKGTAALVENFRFRTTYGFMPQDQYSLAIQTSGSLPQISADDLPPRFEQYLVVEVTISIDGKVVEARIVTGMVDQKIQDRVLAAVRDFKYIPAKHNGSPISSQVDIVVHVPS